MELADLKSGRAIVVCLVVAIVGAAPIIWAAYINDDDPPQTSITIQSITARGNHKGISSQDGFVARGKVVNLPAGDSIWLMDKDETSYAIAQEAARDGSRWQAESHPLGDSGAVLPFDLTATMIWANAACADTLRAAIRRDQWTLDSLPDGCREADSRKVTVTEA